MKWPLLPAALLLAAPSLAAQVDSTRRAVVGAVALGRLDTTRVRVQRPVSRVVLETTWSTVDPGPAQASAVLAKPRWSGDAVLYRRVAQPAGTTAAATAGAIQVSGRRVPPRATQTVTARDDSTIVLQRAADYRVRAAAIARIDAAAVHPTVAANLITELDSVGAARLRAGRMAGPELGAEEEDYAEYVVSLTRAVVQLRDPRAVRAVALGGLGSSRQAQRFVAEQGIEGLAVLDTVFAASDDAAPAAVTTWAMALAGSPSRLSFEDSVYVYARIVLAAQYHPVAFTHAARLASLFDLTPELDSLAAQTSDSLPAVAGAARAASRILADRSASAPARDWLARLRLRTGVLCMNAQRLGEGSCRELLDATVAASRGIGSQAARRQAAAQYQTVLDRTVRERRMSADTRARLLMLLDVLVRSA